MASKYLQKYPVPEGFQEILHDFTKEVLRAQSDDIIQFAYDYFDHKSRGLEYKFQSRFNIDPSGREHKQYEKVSYEQLGQQAQNVVHTSNQSEQRQVEGRSDRAISGQSGQTQTTHGQEKNLTKEFMGGLYGNAVNEIVDGGDQGDSQPHERSIQASEISINTTHKEEKIAAQQFSNEIYDKAIEQHVNEQPQQQQKEEVVLDGPIEEYENAALMIQKNFKKKQANKQK